MTFSLKTLDFVRSFYCLWTTALLLVTAEAMKAASLPLSPESILASRDGKTLFVACKTGNSVLLVDTVIKQVVKVIPLPGPASGLALASDEKSLFVTCTSAESPVCRIDLGSLKIVATLTAGHTATAPVLSPDQKILFVCNRFNHDLRRWWFDPSRSDGHRRFCCFRYLCCDNRCDR